MARDARTEDVQAWLRKAELDLRAADHDLTDPEGALAADAVFHAQQAAEKSLKAFLAWHDVPFRKTHNLEELGRECVKLDATVRGAVDPAVPLSEYAWRFRYPGEIEEPTADEAREAITIAKQLYETVLTRLPRTT